MLTTGAAAEEEDGEKEGRLYATRQERREAGIQHEVLDELSMAGLLEFEHVSKRFSLADSPRNTETNEFVGTAQLSAEATPLSWLKGEIIYEYDTEKDSHTVDELIVSIEVEEFELELGKLYVPFGEYYSHFVSGPLIEFGETRARGAVLSYAPDDQLDIATFLYYGHGKKLEDGNGEENRENLDWGVTASGSPNEVLKLHLGFISDLADSEETLLEDEENRYERRVPGITTALSLSLEQLHLTAEALHSLGSFSELDADRNSPSAWNIELAFDVVSGLEGALRFEGSSELEDEPKHQTGIALTWRVHRRASITAEYLLGFFKRGLAEDSDDQLLKRIQQFGLQATIEL